MVLLAGGFGVVLAVSYIFLRVQEDPRVEIRGFGSFKVKARRSREGRNPKTGDSVSLTGKYVPHFKAGKELRERVDSDAMPVSTKG